jgi:Tol biopolymer transport system component/predicted Ser/Thr protein kinase
LGPYRIEGLLGAGGMGKVFQAVDTRLGRKVAIKISTEQFSVRFEREARAISALNHPHICTLYDVGPNYLVMELVEGETLVAKLKKGKLSIDDTLRYGGQIAAALAEAHSKGITHRDLKPANVMVAKNGVKVLDFGLAKSAGDETMTASNAVMGTPAYMAPEQLEGKECDARTDIYALGLVLREMATGRRDGVTSGLPTPAAHVIDRCLAKEPESRWHSVTDVKFELEWIADAATEVPRPATATKSGYAWPWMAVAAVAVLFAAIGWWRATRPGPLHPRMSLNLDLADETPLVSGGGGGNRLALSPDGARLALTLRGADRKVRLYTRLLEQNQVTPLAGTEDASFPFFSPDGEWIGFFADGKLKKISVGGGAAVTLCDAPAGRGATWGDDGDIIAALTNYGGLSRVPSSGGTPELVTKLKPGENTHRWPQVLPGGHAVLFTAAMQARTYDEASIDAVSLKTGERKTMLRGGNSPRYLATSNGAGHLVYLRQSTLFAVPFNPSRLTLAGAPTPILGDVAAVAISGGEYAFAGTPSGHGTFVYLAGKGSAGRPISWLDSAGKTEPLHAGLSRYSTPRFSPDGKRLAFSAASGSGADIWVMDLDRDNPSRLSFFPGVNRYPVWTPDGKNIVYQSMNQAAPGLYWIRSDGSGGAKRLTDDKPGQFPSSFSPAGKRLAFVQSGNGDSQDIFTVSIEGDADHPRLGKPELFQGNGAHPAFSPDGLWLAYASNESGTAEVYVRPFPGRGGR